MRPIFHGYKLVRKCNYSNGRPWDLSRSTEAADTVWILPRNAAVCWRPWKWFCVKPISCGRREQMICAVDALFNHREFVSKKTVLLNKNILGALFHSYTDLGIYSGLAFFFSYWYWYWLCFHFFLYRISSTSRFAICSLPQRLPVVC